jgi:hypothetical protein
MNSNIPSGPFSWSSYNGRSNSFIRVESKNENRIRYKIKNKSCLADKFDYKNLPVSHSEGARDFNAQSTSANTHKVYTQTMLLSPIVPTSLSENSVNYNSHVVSHLNPTRLTPLYTQVATSYSPAGATSSAIHENSITGLDRCLEGSEGNPSKKMKLQQEPMLPQKDNMPPPSFIVYPFKSYDRNARGTKIISSMESLSSEHAAAVRRAEAVIASELEKNKPLHGSIKFFNHEAQRTKILSSTESLNDAQRPKINTSMESLSSEHAAAVKRAEAVIAGESEKKNPPDDHISEQPQVAPIAKANEIVERNRLDVKKPQAIFYSKAFVTPFSDSFLHQNMRRPESHEHSPIEASNYQLDPIQLEKTNVAIFQDDSQEIFLSLNDIKTKFGDVSARQPFFTYTGILSTQDPKIYLDNLMMESQIKPIRSFLLIPVYNCGNYSLFIVNQFDQKIYYCKSVFKSAISINEEAVIGFFKNMTLTEFVSPHKLNGMLYIEKIWILSCLEALTVSLKTSLLSTPNFADHILQKYRENTHNVRESTNNFS